MAASYQDFTGTTSKVKDFTFPYIKQSDIKVRKTTAAGVVTELVEGTLTSQSPGQYTWTNATRITTNDAPVSGDTIRVYRDTASDALVGTFYPGSAIRSSDLNDNFTQNLYVTQEAEDSVDSAVTDATSAKTTATAANTTAAAAETKADTAISTANTASTNATSAVSTANTASTNAASAVTTANNASTTATSAEAAVSSVLPYTIVANKAALLAATVAQNDIYEVTDTTDLEDLGGGSDVIWVNSAGATSGQDIAALKPNVTWDSGITLKMKKYGTSNTDRKWIFQSYFANDPESKYVRGATATFTGDLNVDNAKVVKLSEADSNGAAFVGLKGPTDMGAASSYTVTLPSATPTANQILKADASTPTTLTWATDSATDATKLPLGGGTMTGNIVMSGSETVDGRDLSADGTKLDAIEASADVTDATNVAAAGAGMLTVDQAWSGAQRGTLVTVTGASTTAFDFNLGNNFYLDMATAGITTVNASNATAGQSGSIIIKGHGSNTMAGWNAVYKFSGGTAPTLTADAAKYDRIDYIIYDASNIHMVWSGNY